MQSFTNLRWESNLKLRLFDTEHFLCFRVGCQGQGTTPTGASIDPGTASAADQAMVPSTVSVTNTPAVLPASSTPEVKAQTTSEPYKPSSGYTTQYTGMSHQECPRKKIVKCFSW